MARRVGGDRLEVALVLPPGRTEHGYDPTPKEIQRFAGTKLSVVVGLDLDAWAERIVKGAAGEGVTVLSLGAKAQPMPMGKEHVGEEEAEEAAGKKDDDHHGGSDPHFWLDPLRMAQTVEPLVEAYAKLSPPDAGYFQERGAEVKRSLQALHGRIEGRARSWSRHGIVTFHGSFGYYAARYGLTIAAVVEPFPGKEPTPKYLTVVLDAIKTTTPAALFSEPQLDKRPAQVIADQSKLPLFELDPVGGVAPADTYERLLESDTDVLERALK